jgi:hypothetical protein
MCLFIVVTDVHYYFTLAFRPNVVAEGLTLELRIREIQGSNLGQETRSPEFLRSFPQFVQASAGIVPKIRPIPLTSTSFPLHHSLSPLNSTLYNLSHRIIVVI